MRTTTARWTNILWNTPFYDNDDDTIIVNRDNKKEYNDNDDNDNYNTDFTTLLLLYRRGHFRGFALVTVEYETDIRYETLSHLSKL